MNFLPFYRNIIWRHNTYISMLFTTKDVEEISFPVLPCEVAVLEHPTAKTKNSKYGFEFDGGLKQELITYFKKDTD